MKTISIAICEDNPASLDYIQVSIKEAFSRYGITSVLSAYPDSSHLLRLVQEGQAFQMYFLDIDMPVVSGLTLGGVIRERDPSACILYVSAREEYVFEAIRVQPFRFIRKAHYKEDLAEAVSAYVKELEKPDLDKVFVFESPTETYRFPVDDIRFVHSEDNYCRLTLREGSVLLRMTLTQAQEKLLPWRFLRIHKSYLVNFRYIHMVRKNEVLLEDGTTLPVSRSRQAELMKEFKEYLMEP